jgi:hypothetical protein
MQRNLANGRLIVESDGTAITPFVIRDTASWYKYCKLMLAFLEMQH